MVDQSSRVDPKVEPKVEPNFGEVLPPPADIGLPEKFARWQPTQSRAVLQLLDSPRRFVVMNMPTGAGKSLVYTAAAKLNGGRTVILTGTKGLQTQLIRDFSPAGMVEVRGQNSYPCRALQSEGPLFGMLEDAKSAKTAYNRRPGGGTHEFSVEDGPCHAGVQCPIKSSCDYFVAVDIAKQAELLVTNYAFYLAYQNFTEEGLGPIDMLVLDEAHEAPDQLGEFIKVELSAWEIQTLLQSRPLEAGTGMGQWREWGAYHCQRISQQIDDIRGAIKGYTQDGSKMPGNLLRQSKSLKRIHRKLSTLTQMQGEWVTETTREGNQIFSPVWPGPYAEGYLFKGIKKVALVSATVNTKTAHYLGIKQQDMEFHAHPSTFAKHRRPVIHVETVRMNFRTEADPGVQRQLLARIDQIVGPRVEANLNGIIHTVSYARRDKILKGSDYRSHMMSHESYNAQQVVAMFKAQRGRGRILISPSMSTGYDFPGDECRWQIILKVPFPDSRGELMKARVATDNEYVNYLAVMELVQQAGRGMRGEQDWCETFILDDNIGWFMFGKAGVKDLLPKWFLDAYRSTPVVPGLLKV